VGISSRVLAFSIQSQVSNKKSNKTVFGECCIYKPKDISGVGAESETDECESDNSVKMF